MGRSGHFIGFHIALYLVHINNWRHINLEHGESKMILGDVHVIMWPTLSVGAENYKDITT